MTAGTVLTCGYHRAGDCRSCTTLGVPYPQQVSTKDARVRAALGDLIPAQAWSAPALSPDRGFRNKAKLAVGGTREQPTLGLTDAGGHGVDLRECAIHEPAIWEVIPDLAGFVTFTGLEPYDVARRRGQLKFIIATTNRRGELLLRFVVREQSDVDQLRRALPALLSRLPQVRSVSANLHPEHKAVLEGPDEVHLHGSEFFEFPLAERTVLLRHRSFFQTNTAVAEELYEQARGWADEVKATSVLDLFCGVGGFGLHLSAPGRTVHGVEIEPDAVEAANRATSLLPAGHGRVSFAVGDATTALSGRAANDLVIVNPPRRGLGAQLCTQLEEAAGTHIIYSSCQPATLAADLRRLPSFTPIRARMFDMFPQTTHSEVAVLLQRG